MKEIFLAAIQKLAVEIPQITKEVAQEIHVTKDDLVATAAGGVTGTIYGFTQNDIAAIMTILIGGSVILHKLSLIFIALHKHFTQIKYMKEQTNEES